MAGSRTIISGTNMKGDLFSKLPSIVSVEIISLWLDIGAIGRLDSACCNKSSRSTLMSVFSSREFVVQSEVEVSYGTLTKWLLRKEIKISNVAFLTDIKEHSKHALFTYFRKYGKYVHKANVQSNRSEELFLLALHCTNITHLTYNYYIICYAFRELVLNNPNIRELYLSGIDQHEEGVFDGLTLHKLEVLSVGESDMNDEYCFPWSADHFSDTLQKVHFSSRVEETFLQALLRKCPHVKCWSLGEFTEDCLEIIATLQPNVLHLDLSLHFYITSDEIASAAKNFHNLRSLNIRSDYDVIETGLVALVEQCGSTLEELHMTVGRLGLNTLKAFESIALKCIALKYLYISTLRDDCLCAGGRTVALIQGLPQLQKLYIQHESIIGPPSRQLMREMRPDVEIIVLEDFTGAYNVLNMPAV